MTASSHSADSPMAEPGQRPSGASTGGMAKSADAGLGDALQRSSERGDEPGTARASTGSASGGASDPRVDIGGTAEPGSGPGTSSADRAPAADRKAQAGAVEKGSGGGVAPKGFADERDEGDDWRHPPVAPHDENPLKSLGRSVTDAITGSDDVGRQTTKKPG